MRPPEGSKLLLIDLPPDEFYQVHALSSRHPPSQRPGQPSRPPFRPQLQHPMREFRQPLQVQSHLEMSGILVQLGHIQRT